MALPKINIYTDGSCSPNPGPGGWAAIILPEKGKKRELSGKVKETTNNRMELQAALEGLKSLPHPSAVSLYTDSKYVQKGITSWISAWKRNNWRTAAKEPVKNQDLWEHLDRELQRHQVKWNWVKGHADNKYNERADELAVAARGCPVLPLSEQTAVHIFVGITWSHKTQRGSWAAVFRYQNHYKVVGKQIQNSTANRIHIQAAADCLVQLKRRLPVHLYTSSGYLKDGAGNWMKGWERNGWHTKEGVVVSNREEWQELSQIVKNCAVTFHVVDKEMPPCHSQEAKELAREYLADPT